MKKSRRLFICCSCGNNWTSSSAISLVNYGIIFIALTTTTLFIPVAAMATASSSQQQQQQPYCPTGCECTSEFYVYCQSAGLLDSHLSDIVSQVSQSVVLLDLSANQITSLPPEIFKPLANLEYLYLSSNQIVDIPENAFRCLQSLKQLHMSDNSISRVHTGTFYDLTTIEFLDLSRNNLSTIPPNTFNNLKTLEELHLQDNSFTELVPNIFSGLDSLTLLNLSDNRALSSIQAGAFSGLSALRNLDLSDCSLSVLTSSAFSGLFTLDALALANNFLTNCTFITTEGAPSSGSSVDFMNTLTVLSLSDNQIESLPDGTFSLLSNLRRLDVSRNALSSIEPAAFADLRLDSLNLRRNILSELDPDVFDGVLRISELDLSDNQIFSLPPAIFDSVRETAIYSVNLSANSLTYIHTRLFREMRALSYLDLSHNSISAIDSGALNDLDLLEELDLSGNELVVVTPDMVSGPVPSLRKLSLTGNPVEEIRGFEFYDQEARILIETEAKVISLTSSSALVTWPFTQGSQLYWSLTVVCDSSSSSSSSPSSNTSNVIPECQPPTFDPVLKPYWTQVNITALTADTDHTVCVLPVFVSPQVQVSQCVHLRTRQEEPEVTPSSITDRASWASSTMRTSIEQTVFCLFTSIILVVRR